MEVGGEGERHHGRLPALCRGRHGGLRGGGEAWWGDEYEECGLWHHHVICIQSRRLLTVAGSADAQVGEVGGEAACAVGGAEGGEGHGVIWVQRGGQGRRELDVGQVRK